jgi:hypothetical protein
MHHSVSFCHRRSDPVFFFKSLTSPALMSQKCGSLPSRCFICVNHSVLFWTDFVLMSRALFNNFWNETYDVCLPSTTSVRIASRCKEIVSIKFRNLFACYQRVESFCVWKLLEPHFEICGDVPFGLFCLSCSHVQEYSFIYTTECYCFLKKQQAFRQIWYLIDRASLVYIIKKTIN